MAVTYYGACDTSGVATTPSGKEVLSDNYIYGCKSQTYVVGSAGTTYNVASLGAWGEFSQYFYGRVAIYDNAGDLVAETAELNGSSYPASDQWLTGSVTQYHTIVGGDSYTLVVQRKPGSSYGQSYFLTVTNGVAGYVAHTYGAFPSTKPSMGSSMELYIARVGVEEIASATGNPYYAFAQQ